MSKLKANKQESITPFDVVVDGETWTITDQRRNSEDEVVLYNGFICSDGIKFSRYFSPEEVEHDQKD